MNSDTKSKPKAKSGGKGRGKGRGQGQGPAPRQRQRGPAIPCPKCGKDAFVNGTVREPLKAYPKFMSRERVVRYCKCAACGHTFKGIGWGPMRLIG